MAGVEDAPLGDIGEDAGKVAGAPSEELGPLLGSVGRGIAAAPGRDLSPQPLAER